MIDKELRSLVAETMPCEMLFIQDIYSELRFPDYREDERRACLSLLYRHSRDVADLALELEARRPELGIDKFFVEEAALLHDVGVVWTDAPAIHCHGTELYIRHGEIGKHFLLSKNLPLHANVAARHTGAGIPDEEIIRRKLPIEFGAVPISLEEKLVCYADKFYSKLHPERRKTQAEARKSLEKFGEETLLRFDALTELFGEV